MSLILLSYSMMCLIIYQWLLELRLISPSKNCHFFTKKRVFDCKSIKDFNTHLMSHSWDEVYQMLNDTNNPTIAFTTFSNEYKHIFNKFFTGKSGKTF